MPEGIADFVGLVVGFDDGDKVGVVVGLADGAKSDRIQMHSTVLAVGCV